MESTLLQKLATKTMTKDSLLKKVQQNPTLIPEILQGISSPKPAIRYGCGKILMDLSEKHPEHLYDHMEFFIKLLDSKYRILTWNAMAIIANLTKVDRENKFDNIFDTYYGFLDDEYMVTVANVVGNSGKIALAKPYLIPRIVDKLLMVDTIRTTEHLSKECKQVIAEHAIKAFDMFYPQIEQKSQVIVFVQKHLNSPRKTLRSEAERFLKKWG